MRNSFILFFIFMLLFSCNKDEYYKKEIIGDWVEVDRQYYDGKEIQFSFHNYFNGHLELTFLDNEKLINKQGFSILKENDHEDRICHYLGNVSNYTIDNEKLGLFDLKENKYLNFDIKDLKKDTLILIDKKKQLLFLERINYNLKCKDTFDKILISSSGCFGSCPISNTLINKNGQILFEGIDYNTKQGLFKAKITSSEFDEILKSFQKADWKNLKENYEASHTDDEAIRIFFIKDDKIIKTIKDYGREAPKELLWAYQPLRFLYQRLKLTPIIQSKEKLDKNALLLFKIKDEIYSERH